MLRLSFITALITTCTITLTSPTDLLAQNNSNETSSLAAGTATSATTYEAAPINIMALPPEDEFKDEFALPNNPSPQLIARRNRIDQNNAELNRLAESIQKIIGDLTLDSPKGKYDLLKAQQDRYDKMLLNLENAQEEFRSQLVEDNDAAYSNLQLGPNVTPVELSELD